MSLFKKYNLTLLQLVVCLVFFVTPVESIGISEESSSFSIVKVVVLLLLAVWFVTSRRLEQNSITKFFIVLGAYWLMSCTWALNPTLAFNNLLKFYIPSVITIMIIGDNICNKDSLRNVLVSYLLGSIILAYNCHVSRAEILANALYADMERVTALGQDQNELSFLLVMGIVIALHGIQTYSNKFLKAFLLLCSAFLTYAILLTGSRTGVIMIISVVALFAWNNKQYTSYLLPILILTFPLIISQIPESSIERILDTRNSLESGNLSNRGGIWARGFKAFMQENYVLGVGYQNFGEMMRLHYGHSCAAHNTYLSYLFTGGVAGAIFLITILVKLFKYCRAIVRTTNNSYWFAYLFPLIIAMLTLETQYRRWLFLISIVIYKAFQISKRNNEINLIK